VHVQYASEFDRLLDHARELLGASDDALLAAANTAVNQALTLRPESVEGWLVKCQIASATGDDLAALAAAEMAVARAPLRAEPLYWRGAVLGDLGRHREALRAIEAALRELTDDDHWMIEDLYYEKAMILEALGLHEAALSTCEAGLASCPGSALLRAAMVPLQRAGAAGAASEEARELMSHRARVKSSLKVLRGGQA
jgi:tetratricopeptide (TPR) repeat protein